jgi:hypothetical protein
MFIALFLVLAFVSGLIVGWNFINQPSWVKDTVKFVSDWAVKAFHKVF